MRIGKENEDDDYSKPEEQQIRKYFQLKCKRWSMDSHIRARMIIILNTNSMEIFEVRRNT